MANPEPGDLRLEELSDNHRRRQTKGGVWFTTVTVFVGAAMVIVMVFATFAPGPRPFLRTPVEVLGSTETIPSDSAAPASDVRVAVAANDDWAHPEFGSEDSEFGDDPVLDELYSRCADEDLVACDDLHFVKRGGRSSYELFGLTCGDRTDLIRGTCGEQFLDQPFDPQFDYAVGDCVVLPRSDGGLFRRIECNQAHDAEVLATLATTEPLHSLDGTFIVSPDAGVEMIRTCAATIETLSLGLLGAGAPADIRGGIIAPTSASQTTEFACFVWAPGKALRKPLASHS
ncbi:MAG: hypothetical protein V3V01_20110 [Acidimicrobiales bacterium]